MDYEQSAMANAIQRTRPDLSIRESDDHFVVWSLEYDEFTGGATYIRVYSYDKCYLMADGSDILEAISYPEAMYRCNHLSVNQLKLKEKRRL